MYFTITISSSSLIDSRHLRENIYEWCRVIGWDCMINENGDPVFFEGNMASHRASHYITLRPDIPSAFVAALPPLDN